MQLTLARVVVGIGWLLCALLTVRAGVAFADEASGTWTGELEGRGNYFYERSTRVLVPTLRVTTEAPNGVRLGAEYLLDVIASASIAQTGGGADSVFTELRHGLGANAGKVFDVSKAQLELTVHGRYSTEDDYEARAYGLLSALFCNDKTTTLSLGVTRVDDTVGSNSAPAFEGALSGVVVSTALSQVVSPRLVLGVGYQLGYLSGYLSNPYRRALIGPLPHAEAHPRRRTRHNVEGSAAWSVPSTATTLVLAYRAYRDSWDVVALTPELRVYQELGDDVVLRARYRFYVQTQAYFFRAPRYPVGYVGPLTADPKLGPLHSHQLGLKLEVRLSALGDSFLDFAKQGWLDVSLDRQFSSSRFGNHVIATVGGRLPF